jgi:hypothetical protein
MVVAAAAAACVVPVLAANPLSSADIKTQLGTGMTIKGTVIPGGATYDLMLGTDGKAAMKLKAENDPRQGTWRISDKGFCSQWGTAAEHCYTIVPNGKAFDVVNDTGKVIARWTK